MKCKVLFMSAVVLLLGGCATVITLQEDGSNKIYCGTRRHIDLACAHAVCLDFPFSLVADTVVLPYTVPYTLYKCAQGGEDDVGDDAKDGGE